MFADCIEIDTAPNAENWKLALQFGNKIKSEFLLPSNTSIANAYSNPNNPTFIKTPQRFIWFNRQGTKDDTKFINCLFAAASEVKDEEIRNLFPNFFQGTGHLQNEPLIYGWLRQATNESLKVSDYQRWAAARMYVSIFFHILDFVAQKIQINPENFEDVELKLPVVFQSDDSLTDSKFGSLRAEHI